jgi:Ca2+-transporting ATPase
MESVESGVMLRKPRPKNEGIFAHGYSVRIFLQGCMFALLTLAAFLIGRNAGGISTGRTMAFLVLALTQITTRLTCAPNVRLLPSVHLQIKT